MHGPRNVKFFLENLSLQQQYAMKNKQEHCADTKQIYGGEGELDDSKRPILPIKTGLEEKESSCVVSDV
jgi:hypothetical protein